MKNLTKVSIVVLTYNRIDHLKNLLLSLSVIKYSPLEVIVVDNHSDEPVAEMIKSEFPKVVILRMDKNIGVGGRNRGLSSASGSIIITLDDDIIGIDDNSIHNIIDIFNDHEIGAVCFKVIDPSTNNVINWCHHKTSEEYSGKSFITNEITEGAVAFRKAALDLSGYYPESFFISYEGPDLAYRIMNNGYNIIYHPGIVVKHYHSRKGRENWRRYYYDTRNILWLAIRNYPFFYGLKFVLIGNCAMLIYSIRDGYFKYWLKGIIDSILGFRNAFSERTPMTERTLLIIKKIEENRPGFLYMIKKRLFKKEVRI